MIRRSGIVRRRPPVEQGSVFETNRCGVAYHGWPASAWPVVCACSNARSLVLGIVGNHSREDEEKRCLVMAGGRLPVPFANSARPGWRWCLFAKKTLMVFKTLRVWVATHCPKSRPVIRAAFRFWPCSTRLLSLPPSTGRGDQIWILFPSNDLTTDIFSAIMWHC
jgi:hypothetical protein